MKQKILFSDELIEDPSNGNSEYGKIKASLEGSNMQRYRDNLQIMAELSKKYDLNTYLHILEIKLDEFKDAICLITNLPRNNKNLMPELQYYEQTFSIIKYYKQCHQGTSVIAYSGAPKEILKTSIDRRIIDYVIPRGRYGLEFEIEMIDRFIRALTDKNVKALDVYLD